MNDNASQPPMARAAPLPHHTSVVAAPRPRATPMAGWDGRAAAAAASAAAAAADDDRDDADVEEDDDTLTIPKPYGALAPFKPGSTMRQHIRKPAKMELY